MKNIDFEPVGDRIMVRPEEEQKETASGIIIASGDSGKEDLPQSGVIVAMGNGGTFPDCPDPTKFFRIGDVVFFNKYAGDDISIGDKVLKSEREHFKIIRLDAVLGKVKRK